MADTCGQECIYIYYIPSDGKSWAHFLHEKLSEREYMLSSCPVDITKLEDDHLIHDVNIILVSPDFLDLTSLQPLMVLHQKRSLSVLLGVDKSEYDQFVRKSNICKWNVFETEATEQSVRNLLLEIIHLYELSHPEDVHSDEIYYSDEGADDYTMPSEVRRSGQLAFSSPLKSDLTNDLRSSIYDYPKPKLDASYQPGTTDNSVYRVVPYFTEEIQEVYVLLDKKSNNNVDLVSEHGHVERLTLLNKALYHAQLRGPEKYFKIKEGTKVLGESNIRTHERSKTEIINEMLAEETDPISLLCTSLGISGNTSKSLDRYLEAKCKLPKIAKSLCRILKCTDLDTFSKDLTDISDEECPTLLHFGAEYNLVKFCEALLNMPGMSRFCSQLNNRNETPLQVAKRKHHTEIIYLIETTINEERDSGIQDNCDSVYNFVQPKMVADDIYENQEKFVSRKSEEIYSEPEGRDSGIPDTPEQSPLTPFPELVRSRHDSYQQKKRETSFSLSRDSDYMAMDQQDLSKKTTRDATSRDSDYMPMDEDVKAPPIPPKANKRKPAFMDKRLPYDVLKNTLHSDDEENIYEKPRNRLEHLHLQHSHSESEASGLFPRESAYISGKDEGKSSSLTHDHTQDEPKSLMQMRSMSSPDYIQLPTHPHKKHFFQLFKNVLHHGHDESHEHKKTDIHKKEKKNKKENKAPRLVRQHSIRIHRVLKDTNIKILRLPEKKSSFEPRGETEWFDKI